MMIRNKNKYIWFSIFIYITIFTASIALATRPLVHVGQLSIPSSVVYPEETSSNIKFDHALHIRDVNLDCADCHSQVSNSTTAKQRLIPSEEFCSQCHSDYTRDGSETKITSKCQFCHKENIGDVPFYGEQKVNLIFPHRSHTQIRCEECHSKIKMRKEGSNADYTEMSKCFTCHNGKKATQKCNLCHPSDNDGVMITKFDGSLLVPPEWLVGGTHDGSWNNNHGFVAKSRQEICQGCHREQECLSCHQGKIRNSEIHPGDWLTSHPVSARMDNPRCRSCHQYQNFCRECHQRSGSTLDTPMDKQPLPGVLLHPDNWSTKKGRSTLHAAEARRNISTCVACHTEQDCIGCHKTYNPHGPGFNCRGLDVINYTSCTKCHTEDINTLCE